MPDTGTRTPEMLAPGAPCSMREACARALLDRGGERCPSCPVRELCQSEGRWFVKTAAAALSRRRIGAPPRNDVPACRLCMRRRRQIRI